jgi:hypothetical protein
LIRRDEHPQNKGIRDAPKIRCPGRMVRHHHQWAEGGDR